MFTKYVRDGKLFAVEQKIRELNKQIPKIKAISNQTKANISSTTIMKYSADNMNNTISKKYKLT